MGGASGLLVLAAIGYFWLNLVIYSRYYISKLSGYHVLFLSLLFGSALFMAAHLVLYMIHFDSHDCSFDCYLDSLKSEWQIGGKPATILSSVIIAGFLALLIRVVLLYWHSKIIRWMTKRRGYLIEDILSKTISNHIPIKIYSRNEKFYVAYAANIPEAPMGNERLSEIKLFLISTGFVKQDGTEEIVENYLKTFNEYIQKILDDMNYSETSNDIEETLKAAVLKKMEGEKDLPTIVIPLAEIILIKTDGNYPGRPTDQPGAG